MAILVPPPPTPPTHEFLSPVRNPPRLPSPFPAEFFFFNRVNANLPDSIENRRYPFPFSTITDYSPLSVESKFDSFSIVANRSIGSRPHESYAGFANALESSQSTALCLVPTILDREIDPVRLVVAMANTDELSVVKFSFNYV